MGYFGCSKVLYVIGNTEINYFYFYFILGMAGSGGMGA